MDKNGLRILNAFGYQQFKGGIFRHEVTDQEIHIPPNIENDLFSIVARLVKKESEIEANKALTIYKQKLFSLIKPEGIFL
jgi:hypothetical protein